jgi:hypothetical protein
MADPRALQRPSDRTAQWARSGVAFGIWIAFPCPGAERMRRDAFQLDAIKECLKDGGESIGRWYRRYFGISDAASGVGPSAGANASDSEGLAGIGRRGRNVAASARDGALLP